MELYVVNFTKSNVTIPKKKNVKEKYMTLQMNTGTNLRNYSVDYREAILDL